MSKARLIKVNGGYVVSLCDLSRCEVCRMTKVYEDANDAVKEYLEKIKNE